MEIGLECQTRRCVILWNNGDWCDILLTNMGYREEGTSVSSHVNTISSHHDYVLLNNSPWRDTKFGKPFR